MYLKKRKINNTLYWSIVQSYRQDGKVKQKIILNLGNTQKAISILKTKPEFAKFLDVISEVQRCPKCQRLLVHQQSLFDAGQLICPIHGAEGLRDSVNGTTKKRGT
jgi:hypothetical protein